MLYSFKIFVNLSSNKLSHLFLMTPKALYTVFLVRLWALLYTLLTPSGSPGKGVNSHSRFGYPRSPNRQAPSKGRFLSTSIHCQRELFLRTLLSWHLPGALVSAKKMVKSGPATARTLRLWVWCRLTYDVSSFFGGITWMWQPSMHPATDGNPAIS